MLTPAVQDCADSLNYPLEQFSHDTANPEETEKKKNIPVK
jgi:hypothetical protein